MSSNVDRTAPLGSSSEAGSRPSDLIAELIAARLGCEVAALSDDTEPLKLGLDSLGMLSVINQARRLGIHATFEQLAERPTFGAWRQLLDAPRAEPEAVESAPPVTPDEPFDLALMQHAYWAGRDADMEFGGVATHLYNEFDGPRIDTARLDRAVRLLLERHGMLRVAIGDDGRQRILPQPAWPGLTIHDLRDLDDAEQAAALERVRHEASHRQLDIASGQVFDVAVSLVSESRTRLHVNLDMIAADAASFRVLMADLATYYRDPDSVLPSLTYSFPQYLADRRQAEQSETHTREYAEARDWWQARLPTLPGAPDLPRLRQTPGRTPTRVQRLHHWLNPAECERLEHAARKHGVTPAMALATAFAEAIGGWATDPQFLLNLPLFDRAELHAQVPQLVGDFSSSVLLAADVTNRMPFAERAVRLQQELRAAIDHRAYPGIEVLRDLSRLAGGERVLAPVVYTSALNLGELFAPNVREVFGDPVWLVSQGPQVWLDAQATELDGGYLVNWDVREGFFAPGVAESMFGAYRDVLSQLVADDAAWQRPIDDLRPPAQAARHSAVNETGAPQRANILHEPFFRVAADCPEATALAWETAEGPASLSYGGLCEQALRVAGALDTSGIRDGDLVAVNLPKGPAQVAAVLGVLAAGGAYVPIGVDEPPARQTAIYRATPMQAVITDANAHLPEDLPGNPTIVRIADALEATPLAAARRSDPDGAAYVLFTSGSTGTPKGVEITHRGASNTIEDLNDRYGVGSNDAVLAVSALKFDLSVVDIFGLLSVGGTIVLPDEARRADPDAWMQLMTDTPITVWNTVPVLLDMLLTVAESSPPAARLVASLRLVMLGGDWVSLDLPRRLARLAPGCRCVVLGGATEASIQSVLFEVNDIDPLWRSIPYGHPMRNQKVRVVDRQERDRPDWAAGELWIGGAGVHGRYRDNDELTAQKFVERDGHRWYRTGDLVRWRDNGELEILGRTDFQVKIAGNRIDLGEVESAVEQYPGVRRAVATVIDAEKRPRIRVLAAVDDPEDHAPDLDATIRERAKRYLPEAMVPELIVSVTSLPLNSNGKVDRQRVAALLQEAAPSANVDGEPPQGPMEEAIAQVWSELLGITVSGRDDDFFRLGGDSLIATRSVARLRTCTLPGGVAIAECTISGLMRGRTVRGFASTLRTTQAGPRSENAVLRAHPEARFERFALTPVQHAYLVGRDETLVLGGIGANFYLELDGDRLDHERWENAWRRLAERHDMLRVTVRDGRQQVVEQMTVTELPRLTAPTLEAARTLLEPLRRRSFDLASEPPYAAMAVEYGPSARVRVGIVVDPIVFDGRSVKTLLSELAHLYDNPDLDLPPLGLTFRDYLTGVAADPDDKARAEAYWDRVGPELPPAPLLPLASAPAALGRPRFARVAHRVPCARYRLLRERAALVGLTPSALLLTCYAQTLSRWSARPELTLNLTLFDRQPVHDDVDSVIGDFSSLLLLAHRPDGQDDLVNLARQVQDELARALEHRSVSAVEVQQRIALTEGITQAIFPVVFTSTLGIGGGLLDDAPGEFPAYADGASQTSQVWLDHQVVEQAGDLLLSWDSVEGLFPEGLVSAMFEAYLGLVDTFIDSADVDAIPADVALPAAQQDSRARVNAAPSLAPQTNALHVEFFARAAKQTAAVALRWGLPGASESGSLTYGQLAERALRLARYLQQNGVRRGDAVAVSMPKGPDQIIAVLGTLATGASYVPIGVDQPTARIERITRTVQPRLLLNSLPDLNDLDPLPEPSPTESSETAYTIFTSGSTGEPKGVQMSHRAAWNTIADINARFGITKADRVLSISALEFDLSVYDIFGLLAAGGEVICALENQRRDPDEWHDLVRHHGVPVWNTVPQLLDMYVTAAAWHPDTSSSLRTAFVSGDWVPLDLADRLAHSAPDAQLIAMGGATEAGIWSNFYPVADGIDGWPSVPYGTPLGGQAFRVVDGAGRDCPDWVPGELWIGGDSLADGYFGDPQRTRERFPVVGGHRWYRTGDLGRYRPTGLLEFLGRDDGQVKVRGHRIELGEIEAALRDHPDVVSAAAVVLRGTADRIAAAVVVSSADDEREADDSLDLDAIARHATGLLPPTMRPDVVVELATIPLTDNGKLDRDAVATKILAITNAEPETPACPQSSSRSDERVGQVAAVWAEVLNLPALPAPSDSFFALGGDSLAATRVVSRLRDPSSTGKALGGVGVGAVFEHPVLADFAECLRPAVSDALPIQLAPDLAHRHEPFPLTDVQLAYLRGRAPGMPLGNIGTTYYLELSAESVDTGRWQRAWRRMIDRHDMLRVIVEGEQQRILPPEDLPAPPVSVGRADDEQSASARLHDLLARSSFDLSTWPTFATALIRHPGGVRVGIAVDYLLLDGFSVQLLLTELAACYLDPDTSLPELDVSFRDYVLAMGNSLADREASASYWTDRLDSLPHAPHLPVAVDPAQIDAPVFQRRTGRLEAEQWTQAKQWCRQAGVTPSSVLLACYAHVLSAFSARPELTLNLTLFDRSRVHPHIDRVLGDFTSLTLLEHRPTAKESLADAAQRLQRQLASDLDHRGVSALWVQRELARRTSPTEAAMPVVFTSTLGLSDDVLDRLRPPFPTFVGGASQTPQVWLDHQVMEQSGALLYHWDAVEDLFAPGLLDDMFEEYRRLLEKLPNADLSAVRTRTAESAPGLTTPVEVAAIDASPNRDAALSQDQVGAIWADVLAVAEVNAHDSFFALGGDSLLATRLIGRLLDAGATGVQVADIFTRPVLEDFYIGLATRTPRQDRRRRVVPNPEEMTEPFEATDVQRAYWVGRHSDLALGGVGAYYYSEFDGAEVDISRLEQAWNTLVRRHAELRSVFTPDGRQQFLPSDQTVLHVPHTRLDATTTPEAVNQELDTLRDRLSHRVLDPARWPLFTVEAVTYYQLGQQRTRIGIGLDNIILDGLSMMIVFSELEELYRDPDASLPERELTFRDYRVQVEPSDTQLRADREYWQKRLDSIPPGPQLPTLVDPDTVTQPRFRRWQRRIPSETWKAALQNARQLGLTPAVVLLSSYAEVLGRWSTSSEFSVNVTLFDRQEVHPHIDRILGDFTSLLLVEIRTSPNDTRGVRAIRLRDQLASDLEHRSVSAIWVQRELARRRGTVAGGPVVFTSGLGLGTAMSLDPGPGFPDRIWGISQTPQIWLDHQVSQTPNGELVIQWDAVEGLIAAETIESMFDEYARLVAAIADPGWVDSRPGLPAASASHLAQPASSPQGPVSIRGESSLDAEAGKPRPGIESAVARIWEELLGSTGIDRVADFFGLGGDSLVATRMVARVRAEVGIELSLREFFADPTIAAVAATGMGPHGGQMQAGTEDFEEGEL